MRCEPVLAAGRREHPLLLGREVGGVVSRKVDVSAEAGRIRSGDAAIDERAEHVVVRHAGHIAGGIQARDRRAGVLVDPDARGAVARAQADLGDVHLDRGCGSRCRARRGSARGVGRSLVCRIRSISVMVSSRRWSELEEDRAAAASAARGKLQHHLARPVVALDEAFALGVDRVAAERAGDVGAGRAVVVLDQRVDLEALDAA